MCHGCFREFPVRVYGSNPSDWAQIWRAFSSSSAPTPLKRAGTFQARFWGGGRSPRAKPARLKPSNAHSEKAPAPKLPPATFHKSRRCYTTCRQCLPSLCQCSSPATPSRRLLVWPGNFHYRPLNSPASRSCSRPTGWELTSNSRQRWQKGWPRPPPYSANQASPAACPGCRHCPNKATDQWCRRCRDNLKTVMVMLVRFMADGPTVNGVP